MEDVTKSRKLKQQSFHQILTFLSTGLVNNCSKYKGQDVKNKNMVRQNKIPKCEKPLLRYSLQIFYILVSHKRENCQLSEFLWVITRWHKLRHLQVNVYESWVKKYNLADWAWPTGFPALFIGGKILYSSVPLNILVTV